MTAAKTRLGIFDIVKVSKTADLNTSEGVNTGECLSVENVDITCSYWQFSNGRIHPQSGQSN
jgi:hypothetical protein